MRESPTGKIEVSSPEEAIDELLEQPKGTQLTLIDSSKSPEAVQAQLERAGINVKIIQEPDPLGGRRGGSTVIYTITVL